MKRYVLTLKSICKVLIARIRTQLKFQQYSQVIITFCVQLVNINNNWLEEYEKKREEDEEIVCVHKKRRMIVELVDEEEEELFPTSGMKEISLAPQYLYWHFTKFHIPIRKNNKRKT